MGRWWAQRVCSPGETCLGIVGLAVGIDAADAADSEELETAGKALWLVAIEAA